MAGHGTTLVAARCAAIGILMASVASCSLISLKSPEKPLSTRDLNTRVLTREYSAHFVADVAKSADDIAAGSEDPETRLNALRWKIAAAAKSQRAAGQMAPMMSLLDTWALSVQMSDYLSKGAGQVLFGSQQPRAAALATDLASQAEDLARHLLPAEEFDQDKAFVDGYAGAHPIASLDFVRASLVQLWMRDKGTQTKLVDSLGTVPEALADAGDRLRMYGETGPSQVLWQAQLAAKESGISAEELRIALRRMDERVARLSAMAESMPKRVDGMVHDAGARFDSSWAEMMRGIHTEGETLTVSVSTERQAALAALDVQRAAVTADAARIADQVVRESGEEVRRLVRQALILVIVLVLVVLGIPFAAGYFVGRARRGHEVATKRL